MSKIRNILKILFWSWLVVGFFPAFFVFMLKIDFFQNKIKNEVESYLESSLKTQVDIGHVWLAFPSNLLLEKTTILDHHNNSLLQVDGLSISLKSFSLDVSTITVDYIKLLSPQLFMITYPGEKETNLNILLSRLSDTTSSQESSSSFDLKINELEVLNGRFVLADLTQKKDVHRPGIDFDHLDVQNIQLKVNDFCFRDNTVGGFIEKLSFSENESGFHLHHFASKFKISDTLISLPFVGFLTDSSHFIGRLSFHFQDWQNFNDFVDSVQLCADILKSYIHLNDLRYFISELKVFPISVNINGQLKGTINDIVLQDLRIKSDIHNELTLKGIVKNITQIEKIHLERFKAKGILSLAFLASLPKLSDILNLHSPDTSKQKIEFQLTANGGIENLHGKLLLAGSLGTLEAHFNANMLNDKLNGFAQCQVQNFTLSSLISGAPVNYLTGNFDIDFTDLLHSFRVVGKGKIENINLFQNNFSGVAFDVAFTPEYIDGKINITDTFLKASLDGTVNLKQKSIDANGVVNYFLLNAFKLNREQNILTTCNGIFSLSLRGFIPDSMEGVFNGKNLFYREGKRLICFEALNISLDRIDSNKWQFEVNSDFAHIRAAGTKSLTEAIPMLQNFFSSYFPAIIQPVSLAHSEKDSGSFVLNVDASFKHVDSLFSFFNLDIHAPELDLKGSINEKEKKFYFKLAGSSGKFFGLEASDPDLTLEGFDNKVFLTLMASLISYQDLKMQNTHLSMVQTGNQGKFSFHWQNTGDKFEGDLNGELFSNPEEYIVLFTNSYISYIDSTYYIKNGSLFVYDSTGLRVKNMKIYTPNQSLELEGIISSSITDALQLTFSQVDVKQINSFIPSFPFLLDGSVNGYVLLFNLLGSQPSYLADVNINELKINKKHLGNLSVKSFYDYEKNAIKGNVVLSYTGSSGTINPIHLDGYYFLGPRNGEIDVKAEISRLNIAFVEPFLQGVMSKIMGYAEGNIHISGDIKNPTLNGSLTLRRAHFKIDYLNTFYSFSHTFQINDSLIEGKNMVIFDALGNGANGNIVIRHNHFKDFVVDIFLEPRNFLVLNTTASDNEYFYGKGAFTGVVKIKGPFDRISIDVVGKAEKESQLFLPLNNPATVYTNDFIVFRTSSIDTTELVTMSSTGIDVNLDLIVTPDVEMQILFDPRVGDIIKGAAEGRIRIFVNDKGDMNMFGNLQIARGDYLFTLQNLVNKKFYIEPGGTITWSGDPYEGQMDITARYSLKTSLYQILSVADESEQYKKKIPVHCMMYLKGKLLNPDITFDIVLPESDENTRNLLRSVINTDDELTRQFFALLTLNTFIPKSIGVTNTSLAMGASSTSFEMLSSQFSHWLSQISKDFNIDVSYHQGDQQSASQVDIALGTQLFNDRLSLETNVQYGWGQTQMISANQASALTGDVVVEYKVTKDGNFRIKAFNKSNTYDISTNSPYTQGIAFFYRKDFERFRDIWFRKKKTKK
ncbi:MAG: translocation/assembly module TamB [Bacteroidales bacterium]|nr:translocation/assembly module TamB [Bacteroidales bacterium]